MKNLLRSHFDTDFPAYSDTGYSDTPVTVTVWQFPNGLLYIKNDAVIVTLAYSDTFLSSRRCNCERGYLYSILVNAQLHKYDS